MYEDRYARGEVLFSGNAQISDSDHYSDCIVVIPGADGRAVDGGYLIYSEFILFDHFQNSERAKGLLFLLHRTRSNEGDGNLGPIFRLPVWQESLRSILLAEKFVEEYGEFVISLGSRENYRRVLHSLDYAAERLLVRARDIAALNAFAPGSRTLARARKTETFRAVLLRGDEEVFAFVSFKAILNERAPISRLSRVEAIDIDVPVGSGLALPVLLNFSEALQALNPINAIIGSNGQGKTRLLLGLAESILDGKAAITFKGNSEVEKNAGYFKIVAFTYEASQWSMLGRRGVEVVSMGVDARSWRRLTSMIHDVGSGESGKESLMQLAFVLSQFVPLEELHFPLLVNETAGVQTVSFNDLIERLDLDLLSRMDLSRPPITTSEIKGRHSLSSGERSLLIFCVSTFLLTRGGALVLIDEPENHLHPAFISILMKAFVSTLIATESRAVLVTHSPFVVRELDRGAVMILKRNSDDLPELFTPSLQTLGGDVSMIADHVFQDGSIKKAYERRIDDVIAEYEASGEKLDADELEKDLGNDGLRYLHEKIARQSI